MENETPETNQAPLLKLDAAQMAFLMGLGYAHFENGRNREAQNIFEGLQMIDPNNPYPSAILGAIHQREKKYEEAVACFTTALGIYAEDVHTLTNRGECYLNMGKFEESAKDLQAAMALDPDRKHPAANRARFLIALTVEGLTLAQEQGVSAVLDAKRRIDEQLAL